MQQERRKSKISVLFWPEVPRYETALGLILVPATGLDGDCGMVLQMISWADVQPGLCFGKPSTLVPSAEVIWQKGQ